MDSLAVVEEQGCSLTKGGNWIRKSVKAALKPKPRFEKHREVVNTQKLYFFKVRLSLTSSAF